jgi:hypothetical protein
MKNDILPICTEFRLFDRLKVYFFAGLETHSLQISRQLEPDLGL